MFSIPRQNCISLFETDLWLLGTEGGLKIKHNKKFIEVQIQEVICLHFVHTNDFYKNFQHSVFTV